MSSEISVTFFVLATDETNLLYETVCQIKKNCPPESLKKIIVVVKSNKCRSCSAMKGFMEEKTWQDVQLYIQKSNNIRDAIAELPELALGTHFVFMAADMEMNPDTIRSFIRVAKKHPNSIIAASKWKKESVVRGYGKLSSLCSRTMNTIACLFIRKKATDLFTLYQLYPMSVYKAMNFNNPKSFGYEYTLKPVRLGVEYIEVPTSYTKAYGKKTNYNFFHRAKFLFVFLFTAFRLGCTPKKLLLSDQYAFDKRETN